MRGNVGAWYGLPLQREPVGVPCNYQMAWANRPHNDARFNGRRLRLLAGLYPGWLLVEQPLSFGPINRGYHPLAVGHLPVVPGEAAFGAIAVQVFLAHLVVNPVVRPLQEGEPR